MTIQQRNINIKVYSNINKCDKNPKKSVHPEIENFVTGHHLCNSAELHQYHGWMCCCVAVIAVTQMADVR
jgi:hypothetical protein